MSGKKYRIRRLCIASVSLLAIAGSIASPASASSNTDGKQQKPSAAKCYVGESRYDIKAMRLTIGTARTIGSWCFENNKVVHAAYLDGWAETATPGWKVAKVEERAYGAGIYQNKGRIWQKFKFNMNLNNSWFPIHKEHTLCPRVNGDTNGKNKVDSRCSIY